MYLAGAMPLSTDLSSWRLSLPAWSLSSQPPCSLRWRISHTSKHGLEIAMLIPPSSASATDSVRLGRLIEHLFVKQVKAPRSRPVLVDCDHRQLDRLKERAVVGHCTACLLRGVSWREQAAQEFVLDDEGGCRQPDRCGRTPGGEQLEALLS